MIPKEVTDALADCHSYDLGSCVTDSDFKKSDERYKIIKDYLETTDRYTKDLEQHVDDLVASQRGSDEQLS